MSQKTRTRLLGVVGLLLIAAAAWGFFFAIRAAFRVIDAMKSDLAVAIIAAGATVLVSILSIVVGKISARPKAGARPARVQVTVERSLLSEAHGYAKRKGLNPSQVITHALQPLLSA